MMLHCIYILFTLLIMNTQTLTLSSYDKAVLVLDTFSEIGSLKRALDQHGLNSTAFMCQINADNLLARRYSQVKIVLCDILASEILDKADDIEADPRRSALQVAARQWLASKWNAKQYGDRLNLDITEQVDVAGALLEARARSDKVIVSTATRTAISITATPTPSSKDADK